MHNHTPMNAAPLPLPLLLPMLALALALLLACFVQIDGPLRPAPDGLSGLSLAITDAQNEPMATLDTPTLVHTESDPQAVYVVAGGLPDAAGRFRAKRVDARTGRQVAVAIGLGPQSGFVPFIEGRVRIELSGLAWRRPSVYLWRLPDGGGPGVDWRDSATGLQRLQVDGPGQRTLMTRWVFNSSSAVELRSQVSSDARGKYIAVVSRTPRGWMLYLFDTGIPASGVSQV